MAEKDLGWPSGRWDGNQGLGDGHQRHGMTVKNLEIVSGIIVCRQGLFARDFFLNVDLFKH